MRIWRKAGFFNTLSGRFFLLTVAFVLLAEVMIFVPSMARFRADFLLVRLKEAQIASLAQLAAPDMVSPALEAELLKNAEVFNVVLRRDQIRQLVLSSPIPSPIVATYDLRMAGPWTLIRDAALAFVQPESDVIRVIGYPVQDGGILIEVTLLSGPLKVAMIDYGLRILVVSASTNTSSPGRMRAAAGSAAGSSERMSATERARADSATTTVPKGRPSRLTVQTAPGRKPRS